MLGHGGTIKGKHGVHLVITRDALCFVFAVQAYEQLASDWDAHMPYILSNLNDIPQSSALCSWLLAMLAVCCAG
jgi:hypothetical protein